MTIYRAAANVDMAKNDTPPINFPLYSFLYHNKMPLHFLALHF